ncbi:MAG: glutamine--fructose-6-phosphate transaminase (isomerizing), partial [Nanoarchaeota archaeon]
MCGIISYIGPRDATEIVVSGLKKLEYRGYDSFGFVIKNNSDFKIAKKVGRVSEATAEGLGLPKSNLAVGHTRWATHGGVTEANAHPHVSNNGKIVVVHNGIIENYQEQKKFLESQGFKFYSQTDTEIIPNTIEYHMRKYDFTEACKHSLSHLQGQYALVVMYKDENKLIAVRKEAPLVLGIGEGEFFVASDVPAFIDYTKKVIFLNEMDMAIIHNGVKVFNLIKNSFVDRDITNIDWDAEQAKKGNFEHFFMKEVSEQASAIERVVGLDKQIISEIAEDINKAKGIYLVACGTASFACMQASYLFSKIARKHVNICIASEFPHFKHFLTQDSLIITVSQSGETADVLDAMRAAKTAGSNIISITNVMGSTAMRESHKSILQRAGPEICVLSTKSYTTQLAIFTLLAYELAGKLDEGREKLKEVVRYIYYLTSENTRKFTQEIAKNLRYAQHIYLIGKGPQYPTALEAALKIKEVSYVHAEGYAGGELKHGNIALIEYGTPCIVFTSNETEKEIISNAMELKARGGYIIGVGPNNNPAF